MWKTPEIKKYFFNNDKTNTNGQCNLIGTRAVCIPYYNKIVSKDGEHDFLS